MDKKIDWHATLAILALCRTINAEASALLYSANQFHLVTVTSSDFSFLWNLRPPILASLRHLVIHLEKDSYSHSPNGSYCGPHPVQHRSIGTRTPIVDPNILPSDFEAVLCAWPGAITYVLKHIEPHKLHLSLTCDLSNRELAESVLEPLFSTRYLADCAIRLSTIKDPCLHTLARHVAEHMTDALPTPPNSRSTSLLDLPTEIRQRILEFSDLITPLKEIHWTSTSGFRLFAPYTCWLLRWAYHPYDEIGDVIGHSRSEHNFRRFYDVIHHACRFLTCFQYDQSIPRSSTRACLSQLRETSAGQRDQNFKHVAGCYCRIHHAAFANHCRCWSNPKSLFLVCRTLRDEAEFVFFTQNRIIIQPAEHPDRNGGPWIAPDRYEVSKFFATVRPSALWSLRDLEIVFPPWEEEFCPLDSEVYQDWKRALGNARHKLNLSLLSIRVCFPDRLHKYYMTDYFLENFRVDMSHRTAQKIIETYRRILKPFAEYGELKHLRFILASPWARNLSALPDDRSQRELVVERMMCTLEHSVGHEVLGKAYDDLSTSDQLVRESLWSLAEYLDPYDRDA